MKRTMNLSFNSLFSLALPSPTVRSAVLAALLGLVGTIGCSSIDRRPGLDTGEYCTGNAACRSGICSNNYCADSSGSNTGSNTGYLPDGSTCSFDSDCSTKICRTDNVCGGYSDGVSCTYSRDCTSGTCRLEDRVCGLLTYGQDCRYSSECDSGNCDFSTYTCN